MEYAPTIHLPSRRVIEELSTLNISCSITGNPYVTSRRYSWRGPRGFTSAKQQLVIDAIRRDESGNYTCLAEEYVDSNDVTHHHSLTAEKTVYVDVQYSPSIDLPNSTLEVREHSDLRVTCLVHSNPQPRSVRWVSPGGATIPSARLVLPHIERRQGGAYSCEAVNRLEAPGSKERRTSKSVWVVVLPAEGHSTAEMTSSAYTGVGVVIGAVLALIVVAAVVVYRRRRTYLSPRGQRNPSLAAKVIRYEPTASLRSHDDVIYMSGRQHNSYADIVYVDGGYINPAHDVIDDHRQQNMYVDVPDGGYSQPNHDVTSFSESATLNPHVTIAASHGGYLSPTHDITNASDGGYLHPTHDVTSFTECPTSSEASMGDGDKLSMESTVEVGYHQDDHPSLDTQDLSLNQHHHYEDLDLHQSVKGNNSTVPTAENHYSEPTM
ncbi:carcinoembryonic antigen-related cell adhesion molecule 20-like [Gigantopelta aegis]|uniref:carcinoembryonic antigen-related cell adhesion molecule 20-like n=1 Tax=Gigantopelta aegis TaxID=1735272 RepID=UPI001B887A65|nr:carcinoembryonic antigen-related cell adhesion molecule 20-like [Gigantopelta aegis]